MVKAKMRVCPSAGRAKIGAHTMKTSVTSTLLICLLALAACDTPRTDCEPLTDTLCSPENAAQDLTTDKVPAG